MKNSSEAPICQCREDVKLNVQQNGLEANLNDICSGCQASFLELTNLLKQNPLVTQKEPAARPRARRKPRTAAPGECVLEILPGVSHGAMVDSRRAMHENYSQLYRREQQLLQAVTELENQMALRNQPLPPPTPAARPPPVRVHPSGKSSPTDPDVDLLADAFGVVSLRNNSDVQHVGTTAISEYILQQCDGITKKNAQSASSSRRRSPRREKMAEPFLKCFEKYPEIILLSLQFPCPPPQPPADLRRFLFHLPEYERARQLIDTYATFVTWFISPIPLSNLPGLLDMLYPDKCPIEHIDLRMGHCLASLFALFLFGSHFDMDISDEERTVDCAKYMTLSRAAMSCVPLSEHATVDGIQCMVLLIWFSRFSPSSSNAGYQWAFSGFLAKLVQSLGLHTNGRRGYAIQREDQIRRAEQTFWEYYMQDVFQSYGFGRPVTLHRSVIGCQFPEVEVCDGHHSGFFTWKYEMTEIMTEVIERTLQSNIAYNAISKLDRHVRHHSIPFGMEWPNSDGEKARCEPIGKTFQRAFGSILTQMVLMILHRPYFWEAISKPNHDLTHHRYWRSVVAAYHGASSVISSTLALWQMFPTVLERFAPFWSHCHSASLVLGALATLRPDSQFAHQSLAYLDRACDMFQAANEGVSHLASRLPALFRLRNKARETYNDYIVSADPLTPEIMSPASFVSLGELDSASSSPANQDDNMILDSGPGVYRLQEKGWDHLILQLSRSNQSN